MCIRDSWDMPPEKISHIYPTEVCSSAPFIEEEGKKEGELKTLRRNCSCLLGFDLDAG